MPRVPLTSRTGTSDVSPVSYRVVSYSDVFYLVVAYFMYVALVASFLIQGAWRTWALAAVIAVVFWLLSLDSNRKVTSGAARAHAILRDWVPLGATLIAFREMDWFTRTTNHHFEYSWIVWDRWLLDQLHLRAVIESALPMLPGFFELCYLLVYAVAPVAVWALLANGRRGQLNRFWIAYLAGTLGAYALFPFFPSQPPRFVFPDADMPQVLTVLRRFNLFILGKYSIHSSVFPSAHVSSVFSAAWGLLATLPERPLIGWGMAAYGCCVAIATIYGRYHYAADVAAGFAMSFAGLLACRFISRKSTKA